MPTTPATKLISPALLLALLALSVAVAQDPGGSHVAAADLGAAADAPAPQAVPLGAVLARLDRAMNPELGADPPAAEALTHLRAQGLALTGKVDLTAPLTEGEAVRLAGAAGVRLRTDQPDNLLSPARVAALVDLLHDALTGGGRP